MTAIYILGGVISAAVVLFLIYALLLVFPGKKKKRLEGFRDYFTDYAHRGLWGDGVPENSLTAFKRAADHGFAMELDVRLSKDKKVYVFHDDSLKRMTGVDRKFWELTSDEISKLRLGSTGEGIPTFSQVLEAVGGRVPIMVELKGNDFNTEVCAETDKLLRGYKGQYCIESFNPVLVRWFFKNHPEVMRGQLVSGKHDFLSLMLGALTFNILVRPDFISYRYNRYNKVAVWLATRFWGAARVVWTVKSEEVREAALKSGASVIFEGFIPERSDRK